MNNEQNVQPQTPNDHAMVYLQNQVDLYLSDKNSFLHGHVIGAAQAMCAAGIITAEQWRQIEDQTW